MDAGAVRALARELKLPEAVCRVLAVRGLTDPAEAKRFLRPRLEHLHDPALLADGPAAARRIAAALRGGETLLVHGDYDVDGIAATALLTRRLRSLGGSVVPFVPHRMRDGYDFGPAGLAAARECGASLIVTADCGTMARETVERAQEAGITVVITDHHAVGEGHAVPDFFVNPHRPDDTYPDKGLCGTGVAYKMLELVERELGREGDELREYLDVVALATVADLVPLRGENRVLVHFGLRRFPHTRFVGLEALMEEAGMDATRAGAGALGFTLGPRLNAAGRMGESNDALRLLLTEDRAEAAALAGKLGEVNRARRDEDRRTLDEALRLLEADYDPDADFGVVLASEGWHPGIIGIVASRIVERIHRPTILIALDGEGGRGSGRSIPGFDLHRALVPLGSHLKRFGGHAQAAGLDIGRNRLSAFQEAFNREARARLEDVALRPRLRADGFLDVKEVSGDLVHWLGYLGPHGIGNPGPVFLASSVEVVEPRVVGSDHLKAKLRAPGAPAVDAIGFGLADRHAPARVARGRWDAMVRLEFNEWKGRRRVQARILDLRPAHTP